MGKKNGRERRRGEGAGAWRSYSSTGGNTMNGAFDIRGESHIEVHKFRAGAIIVATLLALVIQSSFPIHFAKAAVLDLPLLVTIYFGLSLPNPSTGLLLGAFIGLL